MDSPQNTVAKQIVRAERFLAPFRLRSLALCHVPSRVFISSAGRFHTVCALILNL